MPRLTGNRLPKYGKHKASGQAVIQLDGQDIYLGPHGSKAGRIEYDRVVAEWLANGRCLTIGELRPALRDVSSASHNRRSRCEPSISSLTKSVAGASRCGKMRTVARRLWR